MANHATRQLLERPRGGQIHFSDVFPEVADKNQHDWWRLTDFDSRLTVDVESGSFPELEKIPIGIRPWLGQYGLLLTDDLLRSRNARAAAGGTHPDVLREIEESGQATIALANFAPRDDENTAKGANGSDFYLATTDSGLEIYTTPLSFLSGLEERNRILSLYRIPTKGHPEFNGDYEQFRSARVIRTRRHPDHLVPVFEYGSREELVQAKADGTHPNAIPRDPRTGHFAYFDKFGNVKVELQNARQLQEFAIGQQVTMLVENEGWEHQIPVEVAASLKSAPLGKLAVYANCSDFQDGDSTSGFVELVARVNGNPSESKGTAAFQLTKAIRNLKIDKARVSLHV